MKRDQLKNCAISCKDDYCNDIRNGLFQFVIAIVVLIRYSVYYQFNCSNCCYLCYCCNCYDCFFVFCAAHFSLVAVSNRQLK